MKLYSRLLTLELGTGQPQSLPKGLHLLTSVRSLIVLETFFQLMSLLRTEGNSETIIEQCSKEFGQAPSVWVTSYLA